MRHNMKKTETYFINHIELSENKAAGFIGRKLSLFDSITAIKDILQLSPLYTRRNRARLPFLRLFFQSSSLLRKKNLQSLDRISSRLDHPLMVKPIFFRTKGY